MSGTKSSQNYPAGVKLDSKFRENQVLSPAVRNGRIDFFLQLHWATTIFSFNFKEKVAFMQTTDTGSDFMCFCTEN